MHVTLSVAGVIMLLSATLSAAEPPTDAILKTLNPQHPRVILSSQRLAEIKTQLKNDDSARQILKSLQAKGEKILKSDPVTYKLIGPRLLDQSRKCLTNVTTTALLYLLTDDKKWLDRAVLEMTTAAAFPDWNPSHFLDTAEMTAALGMGYDWLFDSLTDLQRKTIRDAIISRGLTPGMLAYTGKEKYGWWTKATHNWSQVCNGGLAVGALAIADENPALAASILKNGLTCVRPAYAHWDDDGAWDEGPGYWAYTTQYTSYHMAALQSALGTDFDLPKATGLHNGGAFRMHFVGPSARTFNFADASDSAGSPPQMFFLAKRFDRPEFAWLHRQEKLDSPFDLIWLDERGTSPEKSNVPTNALFHGANVFFLRSSWSDPNALWLGAKGGDNAANHSHLDLGCFVLDALGERFVMDVGPDDYNLPGYFGKERFTYYRLATRGQNTLLINGENQPSKAKAPVVLFSADTQSAHAIIDLTAAYPTTTKTRRGIALLTTADASHPMLLVQDEMLAEKPVDFESAFHTEAAVEIAADGRSATLKVKEKTMHLTLIGDAGAKLTSEAITLDPPQKPLKGITKIRAKYGEKVKSARIGCIFQSATEPAPECVPLDKWKDSR